MEDASSDQKAVIAFLSNPLSYGADTASVERHETHSAIVFLAGTCAYKLKRAVRYPYLDYSTPARRRAMCEAELAVNRRTAPELYIEVRPLVRDENGIRFGKIEEYVNALDWVVVMQRFEQSALLKDMCEHGTLDTVIIRDLAETVADFHKLADNRRSSGGAVGIARVVEENILLLRQYEERPFKASAVETYAVGASRALCSVSRLLEKRRLDGFVRSCHGDLHLNNVCLVKGRPVLFDAIEFDEAFSAIDVLYDIAFLLMELEHYGLRAFANMFFNRYLERTEDYAGLAAMPLFLSCRAAIRAHVTATLAAKSPRRAEALRMDAVRFLDDAISFLEPCAPALVAIGGVSGTGKSALARGLAPLLGRAPGAVVLRSDILRKALLGVDQAARLPETAYTQETSALVYTRLSQYAGSVLTGGQAAIADAVFGTVDERARIAAEAPAASFMGLWLEAPQPVLEARIAMRTGDASDATISVLRKQLASITRPNDWTAIDASGSSEDVLARTKIAVGVY